MPASGASIRMQDGANINNAFTNTGRNVFNPSGGGTDVVELVNFSSADAGLSILADSDTWRVRVTGSAGNPDSHTFIVHDVTQNVIGWALDGVSGRNYHVSTCVLSWSNNTQAATATQDTGISRSAAGVLAFGNGTLGDSSATIVAKTKAGAPSTSDVPAGAWALIRDTTNNTTKVYYNNAGTLMSVALV
jgi:hypothetical protein